MQQHATILESESSSVLLEFFAGWKKENPSAHNVVIHYSHSMGYPPNDEISISNTSYSMLILFDT